MSLHRRSPRPLAEALGPLSEAWAPETLLAEIQHVWIDAVGDVIATEAAPQTERGGVLTIGCSASVWAQELDLMAPTILAQLNQRLRRGSVRRLRCVVSA